MFKEQKGITLVALVITIIVLLILAGVSISLVLGNNGVLTQATHAVSETKKADAREAVNMAIASCEADYYAAWAKDPSVTRTTYYGSTNGKGFKYYMGQLGYDDAGEIDLTATSPATITAGGITINYTIDTSGAPKVTGTN